MTRKPQPFVTAAVTLAAALLLVASVATQVSQAPEVALRAAAHKEQVEGDLEGALRIYADILAKHGSDRALAAEVLLRMADCHQKLGHQEARQLYERLVREYGDQAEVVRTARARLESLTDAGTRRAASGPSYRLVLDDLAPGPLRNYIAAAPFDVSPDGSRLVFAKVGLR
jgi:tetratricopeptide (TPR) repeat protein